MKTLPSFLFAGLLGTAVFAFAADSGMSSMPGMAGMPGMSKPADKATADKPAATTPVPDKPAAAAAAKPDAAWLAQAKAAYPLTTCVVSGNDLSSGSMGDPIDFVYQQAGQPDRLVRFCCSMCPPQFKKDPAKYLKLIDAAAAAKAPAAPAKAN